MLIAQLDHTNRNKVINEQKYNVYKDHQLFKNNEFKFLYDENYYNKLNGYNT